MSGFMSKLSQGDLNHLSDCEIYCVGSRTINGAYSDKSDYDFLVVSHTPIPERIEGDLGFTLESPSKHYEPSNGAFNSFRRDDINIILTHNKYFAKSFLGANSLAVKLGLTNRTDQVMLFQAILYGNYGEINRDDRSSK